MSLPLGTGDTLSPPNVCGLEGKGEEPIPMSRLLVSLVGLGPALELA